MSLESSDAAAFAEVQGIRPKGLAAAMFVSILGGCDLSSLGANERIVFTPLDCGNPLLGCTFEHDLVAGGQLKVQLRSRDGVPLGSQFELRSDNESLLSSTLVSDISGLATWQLVAHAGPERSGGTAKLIVKYTNDDFMTDYKLVHVSPPDRLQFVQVFGVSGREVMTGAALETWALYPDKLAAFQLVPFADVRQLMGALHYERIAPASPRSEEDVSSSAPDGYLVLTPKSGLTYPYEYDIDRALGDAVTQCPASNRCDIIADFSAAGPSS